MLGGYSGLKNSTQGIVLHSAVADMLKFLFPPFPPRIQGPTFGATLTYPMGDRLRRRRRLQVRGDAVRPPLSFISALIKDLWDRR